MTRQMWFKICGRIISFLSITVILVAFQNCAPVNLVLSSGSLSCNIDAQDPAGKARFVAAQQVFQKNCVECHSRGGLASFMRLDLDSESQFVSNGLVVPGNSKLSKIVRRLKNYEDESVSNRSMPPVGKITDEEYSALKTWVNQLSGCGGTNPFTCDPSTEEPDRQDVRRLTKLEYKNSLSSLLTRALGSVRTAAIFALVNFEIVPVDNGARYSSGDSLFSSFHAKAYLSIADNVTNAIVDNENDYAKFVATYINYDAGTCVYTDPNQLSLICMRQLTDNIFYRFIGRPLSATNSNAEREAYLDGVITGSPSSSVAVGTLLFRAMMSPEFLFHITNDLEPDGKNSANPRLSSHAIAKRLSYTLTRSVPNEELLALARTKDLFETANFQVALDLLNSKMESSTRQFTGEWLKLNNLPQYSFESHEKFKYITQGFSANESLREAIKEEALDFVEYIRRSQLTLTDLLTSTVSVTDNPDLMSIYDQTQPAPRPTTTANAVHFPSDERSGLLTRAAILFSGSHSENPVLRGVHIRRDMFCLDIADPPEDIQDEISTPELSENRTTRERYVDKTSRPLCLSCHSLINPVGFALSQYNAFGAYQPKEPVFSNAEEFIGEITTDASVDLGVSLGLYHRTSDAVEFSQVVASSKDLRKCFTRNYFAYSHNHDDLTEETNSCAMNVMYQKLDGEDSINSFFQATTLAPGFRYRKFDLE